MSTDKVKKGFLESLESKNRSASTIIAYRKDLEQLEKFLDIKKINLISAKTEDLEEFISSLMIDDKYSLKTISRKINTMKTLYKYMVEAKHIKENIALPIEHPDFESKLPRVLTSIEYMALRDNARTSLRLYTIIEILLQTGLRIGELSRMTVKDVNLKSKKLTISEFSSSTMRIIELNDVAFECIKYWISKRPVVVNDKGFLFPTKTGQPLLVRNIRTAVNRGFLKVGIVATVNDLRNTFIFKQLELGVRIEKVADYVGHQRISSTEKYLQLLKKSYKPRLNKIQSL